MEGRRERWEKRKAVRIFEKVQAGGGSTGGVYAYQRDAGVPDILTSARARGGGFPIGAMLTTDHDAALFQPGTHGTT